MDLGRENDPNEAENSVPQLEWLSKGFNENDSDQKQFF